jgi:hypothetical protein
MHSGSKSSLTACNIKTFQNLCPSPILFVRSDDPVHRCSRMNLVMKNLTIISLNLFGFALLCPAFLHGQISGASKHRSLLLGHRLRFAVSPLHATPTPRSSRLGSSTTTARRLSASLAHGRHADRPCHSIAPRSTQKTIGATGWVSAARNLSALSLVGCQDLATSHLVHTVVLRVAQAD